MISHFITRVEWTNKNTRSPIYGVENLITFVTLQGVYSFTYLYIFIEKTLLEVKSFQIFCVPEHPLPYWNELRSFQHIELRSPSLWGESNW